MKLRSLILMVVIVSDCSLPFRRDPDRWVDGRKIEREIRREGKELRFVSFYRDAEGREVRHGNTSVFVGGSHEGDIEVYEHGHLIERSKGRSAYNN